MRFNLPDPHPQPRFDRTLRIGNVYACKGGGKTKYWVVVGLSERTVNVLGFDDEGVVTSTGNYGSHVFDGSYPGRDVIGYCNGIEELQFDVTWYARTLP